MNAITSIILWMSLQIALFSLFGWLAFVLMRRRGPNTATMCAATVLGLTLPLAILIVSPWPRWQLPVADRAAITARPASIAVKSTSDAEITSGKIASAELTATDTTLSGLWHRTTDWLTPAGDFSTTPQQSTVLWYAWLPWLMAIGICIGLIRLAAGVWAVNRIRSASQIVDDPELLKSVGQIAGKLNSQEVNVRECSLLRSAATIGWRRPLLLLPADWRSWTETERRIVLAHELAHVARQDYLTTILARLVTAIHFYQPLVLWLSRQLRIQQELAADNQAAAVAGNRQTYLTTLAQMALRVDEQPLPWAARAFLPGTSMLIKRVAWLKRKGTQVEKPVSRASRWVLIATMMLVALAVAGIRGPGESGSPIVVAAAPEDNSGAKPQTAAADSHAAVQKEFRTFKYVPADAKFVLAISPSQLATLPSMAKPLEGMLNTGLKLNWRDYSDIEVVTSTFDRQTQRVILRTEKPFDWKQAITTLIPSLEARKDGFAEYYICINPVWQANPMGGNFGPCFCIPDDHTLIGGSEQEIRKIIHGGEKLMDASQFPEFQSQLVALRVEMPLLKQMGGLDKSPQQFESNPAAALFLSLMEHVTVERLGTEIKGKEGLTATATLECDSNDGAQQVATTLAALRTVGLNLLKAKQLAWQQTIASPAPQGQIAGTGELFEMANKMLADAEIHADGKVAAVRANVELSPAMVAGFAMPAIEASREAAMRTQSMNSLKQLAIAMFVFENKTNCFPGAAIRNADGKPLLSWRVTILPYIEQQALYQEFHLDEPWDSEHNKALIAKMPAVFRDPHEPENSTNSSYFMPTGKGMLGDFDASRRPGSNLGTAFGAIKDGSSNTILLVDAKRDIPWTKPEEIEIDPDPTKPLPQLGGHYAGLILAAFADGHVEVKPQSADPKQLHALFTINGREPVQGPLSPAQAGASEKRPPDSSTNPRSKIEFRLAESEAAEGLKEADVPDRPEKIYLHPEAELNSDDVMGASVTTDSSGQPVISVAFTADGAKKMAAVSKHNLHKKLAILIDGKVIMAPTIQSEMSGGVQISGKFSKEEAERIAGGISGK